MITRLSVPDLSKVEQAARAFYASSKFLEDFRAEKFAAIWTQIIEKDCGVIFAYEAAGRIAGAIGGLVHPDIYGDRIIAEEFFWFIEPAHRGAGILLYRHFEQWARERGANRLQMVHLLDLMPDKVSRFYLREGFEPVETRYSKKLAA